MRAAALLPIVLLAVVAPAARSQESETVTALELRPFAGRFIPTGGLRRDFQPAVLYGIQGGIELTSHLHLMLGGFRSKSTTHIAAFPGTHTTVWQFEAGAEVNTIRRLDANWMWRPFVGAGAGTRAYEYDADGSRSMCAVAYGASGIELQRHRAAARVEARDNVSCFYQPHGGHGTLRNDVGLSFTLVFHVL